MASSRYIYDPNKLPMGSKIANVARLGVQFRTALEELSRNMEAYVDDNTTLAADAGIQAGGFATAVLAATDMRTKVFNASAELTGNFVAQVNAGAHGPSRDLLDFIG